ncbi:MAG: hypothetical protein ABL309_03875 [Phycisphaerales bacterium]
MHTATNQPSETTTFNPQTAEEALAHVKAIYRIKRLESEVTMVAAQTKALETLVHCMKPVQTTGDTKLDAFYARERNRQRLAAIQTLLHIRTVQREKRLRRAMRAKAKAKAKAERLEPNRASDGSQATKKEMPAPPAPSKGGVVRSEADGHVDNGSTVATPSPSPQRGRRWSCADSAQDRMRGRSEPSDQPNNTTSGGAADPSPQPSPARGEGADPPSALASEGGRVSGRMRGRPEPSGRSECGMLKQRSNTEPTRPPDHAQPSLSMPPDSSPPRKRSRYKTRKPKRPKQMRSRKR